MVYFKNIDLLPYLIAIFAFALLCLFFGNSYRRKIIKLLKLDYGLDLIKMSQLSQSRRRMRYSLLIIIIAILCLCLLRPQGKEIAQEKESSSRSILFLIDISKSMNVRDMNEQSRLEYSKWWAKRLMSDIPGDRFGLITFSKIANIECPLTSDPEMVLLYLADLNSSLLPGGGTNIADALDNAQKQFKENERDSRVVVLLSDGETENDKWRESLDALKKKNIPVNVIGLGDPKREGLVLDEKGRPIRNSKGDYVMSLSDTSTLKQIADETGGTYIPWDPEQSLKSGHREIEALIHDLEFDESKKENIKVRTELYFLFIPFAILILTIRLWISESKTKEISTKLLSLFIVFALSPELPAQAQLPPQASSPTKTQKAKISPEELKKKIDEICVHITHPITEMKSYNCALVIENKLNEYPALILEHLDKLYRAAARDPRIKLQALANLNSFKHKQALLSEPANQSKALETVINDYITLLSQYPNSEDLQYNIDLALQQKQKIDQQDKDQQDKDQQDKDQQDKDQQDKDQQDKDQQDKDQQDKDQQDKDQQDKDQKTDPGKENPNDKQKPGQQQQKASQMTEDEANAAFQDELKRQQQLRDLIRQSREQRNKRQHFNPEQDK
ncbi:VWA domain-containing protein [Lentisphaera profundi]|uniref:VWA domain-containing protein n=1 Tax=Lentisphaera profundi TaxID=1658616 RepID=A0ABY7VVB3_9BACT|nr:VWA domain-containing protein [Lentisphaera profundi]WDE95998.1 VWA domain-containing protein [Lentisphaera profundi]